MNLHSVGFSFSSTSRRPEISGLAENFDIHREVLTSGNELPNIII
jgi:hypothetical protein